MLQLNILNNNDDDDDDDDDEKLNLQICCICLDEQSLDDIENFNELIEYNHCGIYYVHNRCLNDWKLNECIICRKKFDENYSDNNQEDNNYRAFEYKKYCMILCILFNMSGVCFLLMKY